LKNISLEDQRIINRLLLKKQICNGSEISIVEILNDVLALHKTAYEQASIKIVRHFEPLKKIVADKVKIMQILVNLIKNSIDSLLESNNTDKWIELVLKEKNETHFIIEVRDNGLGIHPENILNIFIYGFTTKIKGHGFGLLSCASNAKEMGGVLSVTSGGMGKGATFILELPYQPKVKI
jgi:signal transduction histidine kinase